MEPGCGVATVQYEVLMLMIVLGLEVIMNHIRLDDEDNLGSSVGSFDGMTYGEKPVGSPLETLLKKRADADMVGSGCGP